MRYIDAARGISFEPARFDAYKNVRKWPRLVHATITARAGVRIP
jgi:hypothetical protein